MDKDININFDDLQILELNNSEVQKLTPRFTAEEIYKQTPFYDKPQGLVTRIENKKMLIEKYGLNEVIEKFDDLDIEEIRKNFGNNLQNLRKQLGFTPSDMAEVFNCSKMNYGNWENRGNLPKYNDLIKILRFYKISLEDLLLTKIDAVKVEKQLLDI